MKHTVAILTDFGLRDHYVGVMKGVMLKIDPEIRFVDISHEVPSHSIVAAQFLLSVSYRWFPEGTVFLAVVDPGVGSERRAMILKSGGYLFVGPDNGLFTPFYDGDWKAYEIPIPKDASNTFHGRDVFAPAAARLAKGEKPEEIGTLFSDPVKVEIPSPVRIDGKISGKVIYVDKFGNVVTNVPSDWVEGSRDAAILIKGREISGLRRAYAEVDVGEFLIIPGSSGYLEVSIREGNAALALGVNIMDDVTVILR